MPLTEEQKAVRRAEAFEKKREAISIDAIRERRRTRKNASHNSLERGIVRVSPTATNILCGDEDISLWDEEELRAGRRKDKNGRFSGGPPVVVPKVLHDELVRRTLSRAEELMRENLYAVIEVICEIAQDKTVDAKDRIAASKIIIDRVMGKEPIKIEGYIKSKWEIALEGAIVSLGSSPVLDLPDSAVRDTDDE